MRHSTRQHGETQLVPTLHHRPAGRLSVPVIAAFSCRNLQVVLRPTIGLIRFRFNYIDVGIGAAAMRPPIRRCRGRRPRAAHAPLGAALRRDRRRLLCGRSGGCSGPRRRRGDRIALVTQAGLCWPIGRPAGTRRSAFTLMLAYRDPLCN